MAWGAISEATSVYIDQGEEVAGLAYNFAKGSISCVLSEQGHLESVIPHTRGVPGSLGNCIAEFILALARLCPRHNRGFGE